MPEGSQAAVYLTINNLTKVSDALIAATTDAASTVAVSGGGTWEVIRVPPMGSTGASRRPVPVGPSVSMNTITLKGLTGTLRNTDIIELTLRFRRTGEITVAVPVVPRSGVYATLSPRGASAVLRAPTRW